jgi:hypothetical protein
VSCLSLSMLVDYLARELASEEEAQLEEHVFACDACHRRLQAVADLGAGVTQLARRRGGLYMGLTGALAGKLAADGLRIREYRAAPGERVFCAVGRQDDLVLTRLDADLAGVEGVDLTMSSGGQVLMHVADAPIDRRANQVLYANSAESLRSWPAMTILVQLVAGGRTVGEYTFVHAGVVE